MSSVSASTPCCEPHVLPEALSILLVGEGNLSFAYALVRRLSRSGAFRRATQGAAAGARGSVAEVVATTFDSEAELATKYPESATFRAYFSAKQRVPARYFGSVNATSLSSSLASAHVDITKQPFHLVVFNNPHIGFEDLYRQRSLLSHFFSSAAELQKDGPALCQPQEVVVALCDEQAQRWDLLGCAARNGYLCVAAQPLLPADYPGYTNRRHQSDAAFPFRRMAQYWFVQPSPELQTTLWELRREIATWERVRRQHAEKQQPCSFSCASWLQVADALLTAPPSSTTASVVKAEPPPSESRSDNDDFSLNYDSRYATLPMPLLHPTLVADVLPALLFSRSAAVLPPAQDFFTPYLPSAAWVSLYRAQRGAEERRSTVATATNQGAAVPPHLDAAQLGRPLNTKEAKKLERYLTGYGAAMKAKAIQQKAQASVAHNTGSWLCTACTVPRTFETELDLQQHQSSKHSGAVQLAPTLYARVHEQIEAPAVPASPDALETALETMSLQDRDNCGYCSVCGLRYKTPAAYEEHLLYLSPLPGDVETCLTCDLCVPPKQFTDRRGLEQHRSSKHLSA
ncbi:hypothetical protein ABB37_05235 [Leptomonas pyrrhocoris]|uniref:C2H2-type domain-containing protein n=1 Tax=Leptomonas pyrrhocoris TaxID=157538 RepID=A0A0N1J4R2_LEPPY|nr:hypothetical protein ABB37_05235 [Leptomonas pyrrhocoris]KPA79382.1 hypothetical protein ABB37_05235 [Leptomonas pyrrhocoris]|eukprot:XP_015657821.1 hypothetical protein ABB37_05235 [Leptomonas pyrrhocoris]